jgi:hypothetical protein
MTSLDHTVVHTAAAQSEPCRCPEPLPVARAVRKGAAVTVCRRCGGRVPVRLR